MISHYTSGIVKIGDLPVGGHRPIRVQSMTNTDTNDIEGTVAQSIRLVNAGCEMVRITAQGITEANNLALIKKGLRSKGIKIPLIADIHFNPRAAEIAAAIVEKVRINPGNYTDKRDSFKTFTDKAYNEGLERIAERLHPLLSICKQNGTAIRIGTNHGSLSARIMDRFGDTPEGMVESALEFGRICINEGFRNVIFSMKSSNVRVMVRSTRLLAQKMQAEGMNFPLHLGVTEAGDGEDGIIKSAAGIGTLLEEGIGDTIRVSLTGAPEIEIPVALAIADRYNNSQKQKSQLSNIHPIPETGTFSKRQSIAVSGIGGNYAVGVIADKDGDKCLVDEHFSVIGTLPHHNLQLLSIAEGNAAELRLQLEKINPESSKPVILKNNYQTDNLLRFQVDSAIDFGSLLIDGIGDAIWPIAKNISTETVNHTAFAILQATRARITRTEFISCPSCGRTLFDIEKTLQQVKAETLHLKGLKIAVMGCIVNGPGEMADADYGYVGAGAGKVTLYKGKDIAHKNISQAEAIPVLIDLIKKSGDWKERIGTDLE
ncbi:MAG: (E)-4-hydroxy-3-methylbut-2-enyl-diphosphate synthase [Bacteroidales bacterium]|nr:(E)-4-hydroxy-3-methylbut-2-enyl-diphosphate synthase [Bacteroidales bacterium]